MSITVQVSVCWSPFVNLVQVTGWRLLMKAAQRPETAVTQHLPACQKEVRKQSNPIN